MRPLHRSPLPGDRPRDEVIVEGQLAMIAQAASGLLITHTDTHELVWSEGDVRAA